MIPFRVSQVPRMRVMDADGSMRACSADAQEDYDLRLYQGYLPLKIRQACSTSSGSGVRFPGGLHFTTLPMNTSSLVRPMLRIILVSNCPALPTKGRPSLSSSARAPRRST